MEIKEAQEKIERFMNLEKEYCREISGLKTITNITEKIIELKEEIDKKGQELEPIFEKERLTEIFFLLIILANKNSMDLSEELNKKIENKIKESNKNNYGE